MRRNRLTERDLTRIVKRVIMEDVSMEDFKDRFEDLMDTMSSLASHLEELSSELIEFDDELTHSGAIEQELDQEHEDWRSVETNFGEMSSYCGYYANLIDDFLDKLNG